MRVACLTGGGDCPGLNAVIRGVVRTIANAGGETIGLLEGWRGAIEGNFTPLDPQKTDEILPLGGTILGSSRTNPFKDESQVTRIVETFHKLKLDALVAIGGDDTLGVASKLYSQHGLPTIGCPKTIDNDLSSTDYTFGFDTCLNIVTEAIDRLRTTAESHRRVIVVEVMGRHAGWITCFAGIASGADAILVPEQPSDLNEICERLKARRAAGKKYGIVVVSEGAQLTGQDLITKDAEVDDFGHVKLGGIGSRVAKIIEKGTGIETRDVVLGHLQRGGSPSAYDRVLGTRLGIHAGRLVINKDFGKMVALRGLHIVAAPLAEAVGTMRTLYPEFMDEAGEFLK
ncbi:6-phosphofructokinase [Planctomicrobium sp. SH668]|uniref:6-phosphofructokinase n=1 Tax=Planctomicrobium sp. SH668 TaxID=3448126 RepID=UPI003F5BFB95